MKVFVVFLPDRSGVDKIFKTYDLAKLYVKWMNDLMDIEVFILEDGSLK